MLVQPGQKSTPKCVSSAKRASMTDAERKSAQRRKNLLIQIKHKSLVQQNQPMCQPILRRKKVSEAMNFSKFKSRAMDAAKSAVAKKSSS